MQFELMPLFHENEKDFWIFNNTMKPFFEYWDRNFFTKGKPLFLLQKAGFSVKIIQVFFKIAPIFQPL